MGYVAFTGSVEGGREIYHRVAGVSSTPAWNWAATIPLTSPPTPIWISPWKTWSMAHATTPVNRAAPWSGSTCTERCTINSSGEALVVLKQYRLGDPFDEQTTMGPLASRRCLGHAPRTGRRRRGDAVRRLLLGGKRLAGQRGNFFEPTLLADVPQEATVMQEESFGPLVPVLAVADDDEAIAQMNDTPYGLTASVWTRDARAPKIWAGSAGGHDLPEPLRFSRSRTPWTGYCDSGMGSTLSRYGFSTSPDERASIFEIYSSFVTEYSPLPVRIDRQCPHRKMPDKRCLWAGTPRMPGHDAGGSGIGTYDRPFLELHLHGVERRFVD